MLFSQHLHALNKSHVAVSDFEPIIDSLQVRIRARRPTVLRYILPPMPGRQHALLHLEEYRKPCIDLALRIIELERLGRSVEQELLQLRHSINQPARLEFIQRRPAVSRPDWQLTPNLIIDTYLIRFKEPEETDPVSGTLICLPLGAKWRPQHQILWSFGSPIRVVLTSSLM